MQQSAAWWSLLPWLKKWEQTTLVWTLSSSLGVVGLLTPKVLFDTAKEVEACVSRRKELATALHEMLLAFHDACFHPSW